MIFYVISSGEGLTDRINNLVIVENTLVSQTVQLYLSSSFRHLPNKEPAKVKVKKSEVYS